MISCNEELQGRAKFSMCETFDTQVTVKTCRSLIRNITVSPISVMHLHSSSPQLINVNNVYFSITFEVVWKNNKHKTVRFATNFPEPRILGLIVLI
jgi:hypothetical protein